MKFERSKAPLLSLVIRDGSFMFGALLGTFDACPSIPSTLCLTLEFASTVDGDPHLKPFEESRLQRHPLRVPVRVFVSLPVVHR